MARFKGWDKKVLEDKKVRGTLADFIDTSPKTPTPAGRIITKYRKQRSEEKGKVFWNIIVFCQERGLRLQGEYVFDIERNWRFDWYIEAYRVGIEWNGIMKGKSGHTSFTGYTKDMRKMNQAQALGYRVIQMTVENWPDINIELKKYIP